MASLPGLYERTLDFPKRSKHYSKSAVSRVITDFNEFGKSGNYVIFLCAEALCGLKHNFFLFGHHFDLYQSLNRLPI